MSMNTFTTCARVCVKAPVARAPAIATWRAASSTSNTDKSHEDKQTASKSNASEQSQQQIQTSSAQKKKTMAEMDEELRQKMSGLSGDGGESGIEYEDGQPVSMKRSVKNNMFRYI